MSNRPSGKKHWHYRHGMTGTRIHNVWKGMIQRCLDPNQRHYKYYGGRGITVCERWQRFEHFLEDMGNPRPGMRLERKDNSKGYEPGNVVWATQKQQMRNMRRNSVHTVHGITGCVEELAPKFGLKPKTVTQRLLRGFPPELAFTLGRFKTGPRAHRVIKD